MSPCSEEEDLLHIVLAECIQGVEPGASRILSMHSTAKRCPISALFYVCALVLPPSAILLLRSQSQDQKVEKWALLVREGGTAVNTDSLRKLGFSLQ